MKTTSHDPTPTEMDRYSDDELTDIFHDPNAGGMLRNNLDAIIKSPSGNAITDADNGVAILRKNLPSATNPLFLDWAFVYAFIRNCLLVDSIKARIETAFDNPVSIMANPAFAVHVYDYKTKCWSRSPLDAWIRSANAVRWVGVLPADHVYELGSAGAVTSMIALKTSPIWAHLGYSTSNNKSCELHRFSRSGDNNFLLSNVDEDDWKRFCDSVGVSYGLEGVERIARAVIEVQERIGGKGAYGASAVPESVAQTRLVVQKIIYGDSGVERRKSIKDIGSIQGIKTWFDHLLHNIFRTKTKTSKTKEDNK